MITSRQTTTSLLAASALSVLVGYTLRAPELQADAERKATIRNQTTEAAFSQQEAIQRAQSCIPLMTELPITDGVSAYFSSTKNGQTIIDTSRPMPNETIVCDVFGNTGIVTMNAQGTPVVGQIATMPIEEMEKILTSRGVMPHPSQAKGKTDVSIQQ